MKSARIAAAVPFALLAPLFQLASASAQTSQSGAAGDAGTAPSAAPAADGGLPQGAAGSSASGEVASPVPSLSPAAKSATSPAAPTATPAVEAESVAEEKKGGRFEFGSYGRVRVASDGRGGTGRESNVVSHGSRIDEESYAELELRREDTFQTKTEGPEIKSKVVATVAFFPPFFHFSGDASQQIALRNLFAQASYDNVTVWAGSRMYRGDDVYVLDWWPLDNQNTVGGGVSANFGKFGDTVVALHAGMNRVDNIYQTQNVPAVAPFGVGAVTVPKLDRPRFTETLKLTQFVRDHGGGSKAGLKFILYGEAQEIGAGIYNDPLQNDVQVALPSDSGFLVGGQVGYWTGERDTHVNLFLRHARGLAAYDPLSVPTTFSNAHTTQGATESLAAVGSNFETGPFGVLVGGYLRFFRDASEGATSLEKYDEGALVVRPELFIGDHFGVAVEGSVQSRRYDFPDPSGQGALSATLLRAGVIPYFSPSGRGSYKRPQLRIIYAVTSRDAGARALYATDDVFSQRGVEHFIALGAEWWFNSTSYP